MQPGGCKGNLGRNAFPAHYQWGLSNVNSYDEGLSCLCLVDAISQCADKSAIYWSLKFCKSFVDAVPSEGETSLSHMGEMLTRPRVLGKPISPISLLQFWDELHSTWREKASCHHLFMSGLSPKDSLHTVSSIVRQFYSMHCGALRHKNSMHA